MSRINMMSSKNSWWPVLTQLFRYGVVGLLNNLLGYLLYLLVTWLWLAPKTAVTILYPIAALIGYFSHARYAFNYRGRTSYGLLRFVIAHAIGYGVNMLLLYVCVDRLGLPHQVVQAAAIFVVAGVLFLMFRYFVFAHGTDASRL